MIRMVTGMFRIVTGKSGKRIATMLAKPGSQIC